MSHPLSPQRAKTRFIPSEGLPSSLYLPFEEWPRLPSTARLIDPSKLARFSSHGMAPVLVPLRPSSEHILIVRAPGARDQHACHSIPFHRARSASKKGTWPLPPLLKRLDHQLQMHTLILHVRVGEFSNT